MRLNGDHFAFIRDFGEAANDVFEDYNFMVEKYNAHVLREEAWRNACSVFILIVSTIIAIRKEWRTIKNKSDGSEAVI